jgi:folate-binding protein YgfZ
MKIAPQTLPNRAVVSLVGDGVFPFLHNILTCNVEKMPEGGLAYGALLSPQGKILHDVFIHRLGHDAMIDCDVVGRDELIQKLKLYRLRARFEIVKRDDLSVVLGAGGALDPRNAGLGTRAIVAREEVPLGSGYEEARYAVGIADSAEIGSGKLFPHEANFDQFGGVDFKKGCYIGQEVVSRMQHRASVRSRILPVTFANDQYADEIRSGEVLLGEVLGRHGKAALALIRLDRLAEHGAPAGVTVVKLDWMGA